MVDRIQAGDWGRRDVGTGAISEEGQELPHIRAFNQGMHRLPKGANFGNHKPAVLAFNSPGLLHRRRSAFHRFPKNTGCILNVKSYIAHAFSMPGQICGNVIVGPSWGRQDETDVILRDQV